jgi:hypothetical protein
MKNLSERMKQTQNNETSGKRLFSVAYLDYRSFRPLSAGLTWLWACCFFMISPAGAAVPLNDYVARLAEAEEIVDKFTEGEHSAYEALGAMAKVRRLIPAREEVESDGQIVRVDNSWLHEVVDDVVKNAHGDVEQRRSMLIEIADRLFLLHERVSAAQPQQIPKAADLAGPLKQILARSEYTPEVQQESSFRRLIKRLWAAILRFLSRFEPAQPRTPAVTGTGVLSGFRIVILLVIFAASVFGLIQLLKRLKRRSRSAAEKETREVLGEEIGEDVTVADLLAKATELAGRGEYRTAIRRAYIASLFELEQRGKLRLHRAKTNRDYLDLLRTEREIFPTFSSMTGTFEKVWYGQTGASAEEFNGFISRYQETIKG